MIRDEKILVTGATGALARPMVRFLARHNEVWALARFSDESAREALEEAGIHTLRVDLATDDLGCVPEDFDHLLHFAFTRRPSGHFMEAIEVNAIGAGRILQRCQRARAALVVSAATLYTPHPDPFNAYRETDDIGAVFAPWGPSSPVSKVSLEAVTRFAARAFELPTVIVRPSVPYGWPPEGCAPDMVTNVIDSVLEGRPVFSVHDPQPLSVIHVDDMCEQLEPLLDAASVPARILNWCSDEVVTVQEIAESVGAQTGTPPRFEVATPPGVARGAVLDTTRLRPIVGPCRRTLRDDLEALVERRRRALEPSRES